MYLNYKELVLQILGVNKIHLLKPIYLLFNLLHHIINNKYLNNFFKLSIQEHPNMFQAIKLSVLWILKGICVLTGIILINKYMVLFLSFYSIFPLVIQ